MTEGVWAHVIVDSETHEPVLLPDGVADLEDCLGGGFTILDMWIQPGPPSHSTAESA